MTDFAAPGFASGYVPRLRLRGFALVSLAYIVVYFAVNAVTDHRSLNGSAITLWSPDNALSVMLIMESWVYTPIVLFAQIAVHVAFGHTPHSMAAVVCAETTLAAGYLGMAMALRHGFRLDIRDMRPRDLTAVMAVAPLGAAITGLVYCGALMGVGELRPSAFLSSYAGFWIGDAAAMGVFIPATGALLRVVATAPWRQHRLGYPLFLFAVTLIFIALIILVSASTVHRRYLFNLSYLPILLIGLKFGYDAGALTLLFVQVFLLVAMELFQIPDTQFGAYQVMMFILSVSGQALGATVTEWEATTAQLRRQQAELAKVSERATNGALAAAMSHEISQPLASIATYIVGARRLLEAGLGQDKALAALRKAEGEAARARGIVERLRDFVAKGEISREAVDLDYLVETIVKLQSDAARERGVWLHRADADRRPLLALVDRVGVEQALANLVLNAIEAAPARDGMVLVSLTESGGRAVLGVEDNGPGVASEIADRLFEAFETTKPRGMGLGLPLAKEIATRHGGDLTWRPLPTGGTRFELELPLA